MQIDLKSTYDSIKNLSREEFDFHTTMAAINSANTIPPDSFAHFIDNAHKLNQQLEEQLLLANLNEKQKKLLTQYFNTIHDKTISIIKEVIK